MPDIQVQAEDKIAEVIRGMQLAWPPAAQITTGRLPWNVQGDGTVVIYPGIRIYPLRPQFGQGTNQREDVGYGVGIAWICPADHFTSEMRDRVSSGRALVRRRIVEDCFDQLPLVTGAVYLSTKIGDTEVNLPKEAHRYEVSGLAAYCWVRESRT